MTKFSYDDQIRADVIVELAKQLVKTTHDIIEVNGPDPSNHAIISAAYTIALREIGVMYHQVPLTVAIMVTEDIKNK